MRTLPLLALLPLVALAQDGDDPKLESWPALEKKVASTVKKDVSRLRKARTEEMGRQAEEALVEVGAGVAPALLAALGKEKDAEAQERLRGVLDSVTGKAHTRLLSAEFDAKPLELRIYVLERTARFPDPGLREAAEAALAKVEALQAKGKADPRERLAAALAATAAGSSGGLDLLAARAEKAWKKDGTRLRLALEGARGPEASTHALALLEGGSRAEQVAALRLLAGCGTKEALPTLRPLLDVEDGSLRVATVNALRGIVDGDPPLPQLSVFEVIERAKKWKARL